jgi:radical SAM protein with 4Fe4S-binding SPASM domain
MYHQLKSILFEVTYRCNLNCIHCYEPQDSEEEMSTEQVMDLIEQAAELKVPRISFGGGEPLVRGDLFKLLEYAGERSISVELLSNGVLIDEEVARKLAACRVASVSVSLDSALPDNHNAIRRADCFERVIHAIENLVDAGLRVEINTTFTKLNLNDFEGVVRLSKELGVSVVRAVRLVSLGNAEENDALISPCSEDYQWFSERLYEASKKYSDEHFIVTGDDAFLPFLYIRNRKQRMPWLPGRHMGCIAGRIIVSIDPRGDVYPCGYLKYPEFLAGNVTKEHLRDIWENSDAFRKLRNPVLPSGKCSACEHLEFCRGGCRGAAYIKTRSLASPDPYCWIK